MVGGIRALTRKTAPARDIETGGLLRDRQRWAMRRGNPAWLWPDVAIADWHRAMDAIAQAAAAHVAGRLPCRLDGDPAALGLAGYTSGTGPLLGFWLRQGSLLADEATAAVLDRHLSDSQVRAGRMRDATRAIVAALDRRGIRSVLLKGAHTGAHYFPDIGTRPASDVDLLVAESDLAAAEAALETLAYDLEKRGRWESCWRPGRMRRQPVTLDHVHADDPWTIDLHASLAIAAGPGAPVAALDRGRPLDSEMRWEAGAAARVLEQPLLLLHLAAHAGSGFHNLTLLRLIELALVIRSDAPRVPGFWDAFLAMGARANALGFAFPALALCEQLAPHSVPPAVLDTLKRHAPVAVGRIVRRLTPATAQRIERSSMAEHFMWSRGWSGHLRQIAADILPDAGSWREARAIYERRAWQLLRRGWMR